MFDCEASAARETARAGDFETERTQTFELVCELNERRSECGAAGPRAEAGF
jgi:hypothetical protein